MLWVVSALDPIEVVLLLSHQLGLLVGRGLMLRAVLAALLHWEDLRIEFISSCVPIDRELGRGLAKSGSWSCTAEGMRASFEGYDPNLCF